MRILSVDPGGTTGLCFWDSSKPLHELWCRELTGMHHSNLYDGLIAWAPKLIIVERFDYVSQKESVDLIAEQYIGVINLWVSQQLKINMPDLRLQSRSLKDFWVNDKLRALGVYKPKMPHANDAVRHLLVLLYNISSDKLDLNLLANL